MARGKKARRYKVRKAIVYVCMGCAHHFNTSGAAKEHWRAQHWVPKLKRPRGRPPKHGRRRRR